MSIINQTIPKHFLLSIGIGVATFYLLFILDFTLNNSNFFGFFFATTAQTYAHFLLSTLVGVVGATFIVNKKNDNSITTPVQSTAWFLGLHVLILILILVDGRTSYGVTPTEQILEQIPLSFLSVILYFAVSRFYLKKA